MTQVAITATAAGFHFLENGIPTAHEIFGSSHGLGGAFFLDQSTGEWRTQNGIQSGLFDTVLTVDDSLTTVDAANNQITVTVTGASFWAMIEGERVKVGDMTLPSGTAFQSTASLWAKSHIEWWLTDPFFSIPGGNYRNEAGQMLALIAQDAGVRFDGGAGSDVFDPASHYAVFLDNFFGNGTQESPVLANGFGGDDVMRGGANNDTLYGGLGNDHLDGGSRGRDRLYGGKGNDTLEASNKPGAVPGGGFGNALYGGQGDDLLNGGTARDSLFGGDDNDTIYGNSGADLVFGGNGDNWLYGENGNDLIEGGSGLDMIYGGTGDDTLSTFGDLGELFGGAGRDAVTGGQGRDVLHGDAGADTLTGNDGADTLYGGAGRDSLYGGDGDDLLIEEQSSLHAADRNRLYGGAGNDTLHAGSGQDSLYGGANADELIAHAGENRLFGGKGRDTLVAGNGADTLFGGVGNDRFEFRRDIYTSDVTIGDFELATDKLALNAQLWWDAALTRKAIVAQFAQVEGDAVVFRFTSGATVTLQGVTDLTSLHSDIALI